MNFKSERALKNPNSNRKTTKLGIEQLESRLMNSIDSLSSNLQLLNSPGLFGTTQIVSNTPPTVASPLSLSNGTAVSGRTASLTVLGSDNAGESALKYSWQLIDMPSGGTVSFAANRTNAAKSNILTFNKPGEYEVRVTIVDAQGLSTTSSLQFNVVQTLTRFDVKTPDGKTVTPGTATSTGDTRQSLAIQGLDQFGVVMTSRPSVTWQSVSTPTGGTATLTQDGNSVSAGFNRAGIYTLRAQSGSVSTKLSINVTQTLTFINLATPSGTLIDPSQDVTVTSKTQQIVVRGFDQFGNAMTTLPRVTWTATTAPSGGTVTASQSNGLTTLTFNRIGTYSVVAHSGASSFGFSATVISTFTSIGLRNAEGRIVALNSSLTFAGSSIGLSAVGLDQYGSVLESQPTILWQAIGVPTGGTASLSTNENAVTATFHRAGSFSLRAQSGSILANVTIKVVQTLTSINLLTLDGAAVNPDTPIGVAAANQRLTVRAYDQFGNSMVTFPKVTWSTLSAPTGGSATVSIVSGVATVTFKREGSYTLRAQAGNVSRTVSFEVSQVLTNVVAIGTNDRQFSSGSTVSVVGQDVRLTARGSDQFGNLLPTQPDFVWTSVTAPAGTSADLVQSGNDAVLTFQRAGVYTFRATAGSSILNITINVLQTVTSLTVTPGTASVQTNANQQYRYQTSDQFGQVITNQPTAIWTTSGGTITSSGVLSSGTRAGTFTVTAKVGTVSGTASTTVSAPTPQSTLRNAAIANLVGSLYSDSQLTRTEMIQVLRSAGSDGVVDATELEDLRFIASSSSVFAMPIYVRELAKDVVNSNVANRTFKGQAAGNLAVGSSSTLLNNLVDKWFLGADEPVLTNSGLSYQTVVGNLFNGTPSRNDAKQGQLGDCYFIASLVSLADQNPDAVRNLFIDNSDGTYTVRFYAGALGSFSNNGLISSGFISGAGAADYVTVNRRLPTNANGRLEYSGYGLSIASSATTLWIALAEKAYAQWNETGNEGRDGTNRYSSIEGGWMSNVNAQVLGYNSTNYAFSNSPKQSLVNAMTSGKSVTLGTLQNASAGGLVGGHAYTVAGYNATTDTFSLHNPWGTSHPSQLTWSQLQSNCSMFTVADPTGSVANNLASVRSSASETFVGNWTTVVAAKVDGLADSTREIEETTTQEPLFAILSSSLEGKSSSASLERIEVPPTIDGEIAETAEVRFDNPLAATLVDLAMSQLSLNAI